MGGGSRDRDGPLGGEGEREGEDTGLLQLHWDL